MTAWTHELEAHIRDVGDYVEKQTKDLVNPNASAAGTTLRMLFRAAQDGRKVLNTCREAGIEFTGPGFSGLKGLVDLAEQNGSNAGDKIKKAIAVADKVVEACHNNPAIKNRPTPADVLRRVKIAKQKGLQY